MDSQAQHHVKLLKSRIPGHGDDFVPIYNLHQYIKTHSD